MDLLQEKIVEVQLGKGLSQTYPKRVKVLFMAIFPGFLFSLLVFLLINNGISLLEAAVKTIMNQRWDLQLCLIAVTAAILCGLLSERSVRCHMGGEADHCSRVGIATSHLDIADAKLKSTEIGVSKCRLRNKTTSSNASNLLGAQTVKMDGSKKNFYTPALLLVIDASSFLDCHVAPALQQIKMDLKVSPLTETDTQQGAEITVKTVCPRRGNVNAYDSPSNIYYNRPIAAAAGMFHTNQPCDVSKTDTRKSNVEEKQSCSASMLCKVSDQCICMKDTESIDDIAEMGEEEVDCFGSNINCISNTEIKCMDDTAEMDEEEVDDISSSELGTGSNDVNIKAQAFISRFYEDMKLQKSESIRLYEERLQRAHM